MYNVQELQCLHRLVALLSSCWMWHNCVFRLCCLDMYVKLYMATKFDVQAYAFMLCIICIIMFSDKIIILWSRILRKENFNRIYSCYFHNLDFETVKQPICHHMRFAEGKHIKLHVKILTVVIKDDKWN